MLDLSEKFRKKRKNDQLVHLILILLKKYVKLPFQTVTHVVGEHISFLPFSLWAPATVLKKETVISFLFDEVMNN